MRITLGQYLSRCSANKAKQQECSKGHHEVKTPPSHRSPPVQWCNSDQGSSPGARPVSPPAIPAITLQQRIIPLGTTAPCAADALRWGDLDEVIPAPILTHRCHPHPLLVGRD